MHPFRFRWGHGSIGFITLGFQVFGLREAQGQTSSVRIQGFRILRCFASTRARMDIYAPPQLSSFSPPSFELVESCDVASKLACLPADRSVGGAYIRTSLTVCDLEHAVCIEIVLN